VFQKIKNIPPAPKKINNKKNKVQYICILRVFQKIKNIPPTPKKQTSKKNKVQYICILRVFQYVVGGEEISLLEVGRGIVGSAT